MVGVLANHRFRLVKVKGEILFNESDFDTVIL